MFIPTPDAQVLIIASYHLVAIIQQEMERKLQVVTKNYFSNPNPDIFIQEVWFIHIS